MIENSFIYTGEVIHKRFKPKEHFFKYSVFSLLIDLSEIRLINKKIPFFSLEGKKLTPSHFVEELAQIVKYG